MGQRGRIWEPAARWASAPYLWDREHGKRKSISRRKSKADSIRAVVEGKRGCKKICFLRNEPERGYVVERLVVMSVGVGAAR